MNVAIIGCGLIGTKRARALPKEDHLIVVCDINQERASTLASEFACESTDDWQSVVSRSDVDVVINSSINNVLEPITIAALQAGKHVLCEKPLGRNASESKRMMEAARASNRKLKTGFNHRFHPAIWKAKSLLEDGVIGECLTIRARYGHGGRPGMENEWRASKELCGGGAATPFAHYSAYATSKVAIVRLTENLSIELADIDINCVAPGFVITRLHQQTIEAGSRNAGDAFYEGTKKQMETGGVPPEKAADLTSFLLSSNSDGITGKFISAPWDPWTNEDFIDQLRQDKDIATLRRIDNKTFFKKS